MKKLVTLFFLAFFVLSSSLASAEDGAHRVEQKVDSASEGGLPQFDPTWFDSQVFWLISAFIFLYIFFAKKTLPEISSILENRKNHIDSDLEMAEKLTEQADSVHDSYQKNLDKAQNQSVDAIKQVEQAAKLKSEESLNNFRLESDKIIKNAEKNILAAKITAIKEMNEIVATVSIEAVEKIIDVKVSSNYIQDILKNISDKTKAA